MHSCGIRSLFTLTIARSQKYFPFIYNIVWSKFSSIFWIVSLYGHRPWNFYKSGCFKLY